MGCRAEPVRYCHYRHQNAFRRQGHHFYKACLMIEAGFFQKEDHNETKDDGQNQH